MKVGDKIKIGDSRQRFTVQGIRDHIIVVTQPFNLQRTYFYMLIDLKRNVRGPLNALLGLPCDVNSPAGAEELFDWIQDGGGWDVWGVSYRNHVPLTGAEIEMLNHG